MNREKTAAREITLRLALEKPTAGVDFGLQKGRGRPFDTVQKQRSKGGDLIFKIAVNVKRDQDGAPDFAGPYVQGARGERFFYINIGTYAGQTNTEWSRRLKVPISGALRDTDAHHVFTASIPGTARDGGPSCAYEWRKRVDSNWKWEPEK